MSTAGRKPLVSIGLPVYNGERFLCEALESLLAQECADFELIISDNASTDSTGVICLQYAARDSRIRYYRNTVDIGPTANFNRVFELSSGDYFMWAAADDFWAPAYLSSCVDAFGQSGAVVLVGSMGKLIDAETGQVKLIDTGLSTAGLRSPERFKRYKSTIHSGEHVGIIFYGVYRRSELARALPMRNVIANDHVLLAKLCLLGEFRTVPNILMVKRWGGISKSYQSIAGTLGLNSRFLMTAPMLIRELLLQGIILRTHQLAPSDKVRLSWWSLDNYIRVHGLSDLRGVLPGAAKRAVKNARVLWPRGKSTTVRP